MNNVSKKKIAAGYAVLLAVLLYSLFFVHREMENLMSSDNSDILRTDSLIGLLREKDANTVRLLRTLSEANDSMISAREVEQIIAEQDTIITQQRYGCDTTQEEKFLPPFRRSLRPTTQRFSCSGANNP